MLEIIVLPIWYKTWWAIMIFLATFIGFITFVFRFFWMRKSMEAELELERRDKEHQEEINQMKMRFFINISHELRTPLTLILAPLQEIINKISDRWTRNQLANAYGPMLQGFKKIVCDCSRSAPVSEIVGNVVMSCVRAQCLKGE